MGKTGKACGCYAMQSRISRMVLSHDIVLSEGPLNTTIIQMEDFCSIKFDMLFFKYGFQSNHLQSQFDQTQEYFDISEKIDECIDYINDNEGWTVFGWFKRGNINDQSGDKSEDGNDIDSGDVNYHIVHMYPKKLSCLENTEFKAKMVDLRS